MFGGKIYNLEWTEGVKKTVKHKFCVICAIHTLTNYITLKNRTAYIIRTFSNNMRGIIGQLTIPNTSTLAEECSERIGWPKFLVLLASKWGERQAN